DLSNVTKTPVILVVSCKGKSQSVAAEINGFLSFRENQIKGVILNGVSAESYPMYRKIIETHTPISVLGYLPYLPQVLIESRHLGLVTADEIDSLQKKMELLGNLATETIDLTRLIQIAQQAKQISCPSEERTPLGDVLIGVAMDAAFCFYYADNLDLLQSFGAKLVYFSPLEDPLLPQKLDGIIFGGGYPELYAEKLSKNRSFLDSLTNTAKQGIPIYAECGGWMYLQETLTDAQKNCYPMAGILSGNTQMTERLHHFGYVTLTAKTDTLLCKKGAQIHAHEFHYSDSDGNGDAFSAEKMNGKNWECFQQTDHILAGYPHLHFYGNIEFAKQFVKKCLDFHQKNQK
ncbi:MAG: cobyrinate a,c-diamide synthase, partial [Oscillospiraceae bacterium]